MISLPTEQSFSFMNVRELLDGIPDLITSISQYRAKHTEIFTMSDAVVSLRPAVAGLGAAWTFSVPGTPIPSEAWLKNVKYEIGLFQEATSVRVVVWVGSEMRSFSANSPEKIGEMQPWLEQQLQAQLVAGNLAAEEEKKAAALPPPSIEAAVAALHTGKHLQLGVARWYEVYFIAGGKLRREIHDEGYTDEEDCTEEDLAQAMKNHAAQAHEQLR